MVEPDLTAAWRLDTHGLLGGGPGLVAGLARGGELMSTITIGRETADPASPRLDAKTKFYVASVAKQFTAACLAVLEAAGTLCLTDSIRRHVRGLPSIFEPVTLNHLLHHTSGVLAARGLGPAEPGAWWLGVGLGDVVAELARTGTIVSQPGDVFRYANEGYWLLAAAIETASTQPLSQVAQWRLFEPLGMAATRFRDRPEPPAIGTALGHTMREGVLRGIGTDFHVVGDGGLMSSLEDLARWDQFWSGRSALGPDLPLRMSRPGTLNDGAPMQYAWGVSSRTHRHQPILSHGGSFLGYLAKFTRFTELDFSVIVLANSDQIDVDAFALRLADLALEGMIDLQSPSWADTYSIDGRARVL